MGNVVWQKVQQRDIAAAAGVSVSTVSRVLNNGKTVAPEIKERVLRAAAGLNYPLELMDNQLTHLTLFVRSQPENATIHENAAYNAFTADIMAGVEAECHAQSLHLSIATIKSNAEGQVFAL